MDLKAAHTLVAIVRTADWLTADRARAYLRILLIATVAIVLGVVALSRGGIDPRGEALGTDFVSFWAASKLALSGNPAAAWDVAAHHGAETAIFGRDLGYAAFFYPPVYLLFCLPLALLPYLASLALWLAVTGSAWALVMRGWLGAKFGWLPIAAFPAVLDNVGHGQNGFISGALIGAGALWLRQRPIAAGVCFGALVYKPQLAIVVPFALIAARRWSTAMAAAATAVALIALSTAVFGVDSWRAFTANAGLARATLEQGLVEPGKMQSTFAAMRVLGGPLAAAYAAQAVVALAVIAGLVSTQRRGLRPDGEGALLIAATLLVTPFLLDYDLTLLAAPLAFLARAGVATGFRPWEKSALLAGFVLPAISRSLATGLHLPLAPLVLAALFVLILRRVREAPVPVGTQVLDRVAP